MAFRAAEDCSPTTARGRARAGFAHVAAGALGVLLAAAGCSAPSAGAPAEGASAASAALEFRQHFQRGLELYRQGLLEGAIAEFQACHRINPEVAELQFQIGRALMERSIMANQSLDQAADRFNHALRLDPEHNMARLLLAQIHMRRVPAGLYDPDRASSIYEDLIVQYPDRYELRLDYASWLGTGEVSLSVPGDPNRPGVSFAWALEKARSQFEKVLDLVPPESETFWRVHWLLSDLLIKMGDYEGSRTRVEFVLSRWKPGRETTARALQRIGHCQWRLGDYKGAAATFRRAYETDPKLPYLWDIRMAYERLGGYPPDLPASLRFELRPEAVDPKDPPLLKFTNVAEKLGVDKWAGAGPSAWADVDGDGLEDLLACGCETFCSLWRNEGRTFTDITYKAGLGRLLPGFAAIFADYDNDGDMDFYLGRNGWAGAAPDSLLRNNGDGTFTDVIESSGANAPGCTFNAAFADFNRDGWLDLLVAQGVLGDGSVNRLFYNKGDGTFADVTESSGMLERPSLGTIGIAVGDYDADGWPDVFVHARKNSNRLYRNQGNGKFKEVAREAGVAGAGNPNGYVAFFSDMDADGDLDIFSASQDDWGRVLEGYRPGFSPAGRPEYLVETPHFYRNLGGGKFADETQAVGLLYGYGVMSGMVADLDNDGYPDVYFGTGDPQVYRLEPNILLRNVGGRRFEDVTRYAGVGELGKGHGISVVDWDRDGDLDMYAELGGFFHGDLWHSAFFINELGSRNNWLALTLEQPGLNRNAVGAGVTLTSGSYRFYQEVAAGQGWGSSNAMTLHFGLGKRAAVDSLEIRWPDGSRQTVPNPPIRKRLRLTKGEPAPRVE